MVTEGCQNICKFKEFFWKQIVVPQDVWANDHFQ